MLYLCAFLMISLPCLLLPSSSMGNNPMEISIINLIATPEKYHGKIVRVVGFAVLKFESTALYLSEQDATKRVTKNALWIDIDGRNDKYRSLNMRYVLIEGIFDAKNRGHMSLCSGAIKDISRLEPW